MEVVDRYMSPTSRNLPITPTKFRVLYSLSISQSNTLQVCLQIQIHALWDFSAHVYDQEAETYSPSHSSQFPSLSFHFGCRQRVVDVATYFYFPLLNSTVCVGLLGL